MVETLPLPKSVLVQLLREDLSLRETRIFLAIALECLKSSSGVAEVSGSDLQVKAQVHRTHVFGTLKTLVDRGLILKEKQDAAAKNQYRLNLAYFQEKAGPGK